MAYKQRIAPRTGTRDYAGMCLRFVQFVFNIAPQYASAWIAWLNQKGRHARGMPTNVAVAVWFSHWGTYGNPLTYTNWGHVVAWIPGKGYLSSPGSGYGQAWFPTIGAVERYFGAKYVGWTTHVHGVPVVEWVNQKTTTPTKPKPPQIGGDQMFMIRRGKQYAVVGPGFFFEFTGPNAASNILAQITGDKNAHSLSVSASFWNACKRAAGK